MRGWGWEDEDEDEDEDDDEDENEDEEDDWPFLTTACSLTLYGFCQLLITAITPATGKKFPKVQ